MRPMTQTSANNVTGAFEPRATNVLATDTHKRLATKETLVPSKRGVGLAPAYGTFINLVKTNWGVSRFFRTAPVAAFPLKPRLPQYRHQVQNPTTTALQPGFTNNLSMVQTQLGRMVTKGYDGVQRG